MWCECDSGDWRAVSRCLHPDDPPGYPSITPSCHPEEHCPPHHSFTGEDSCELHVHGGVAVVTSVLLALGSLPGYVPAKPGDFTKRAFHHGKLDLTAVEGLGDLIHAETEAQRRQALRQMEGALGQLYGKWRQSLLHCRAALEAYIDFSEDDNIEAGVVGEVEGMVQELVKEMEQHLADGRRGERLRAGVHLVILGRPNVGKSSLLNTIVQRPAAIVSPVPGTTRDVVETVVDLEGYPVVVSDTAGLRQTGDLVEAEGVRRALERAHQADMAVVVLDAREVLEAVKAGVNWDMHLTEQLEKLEIIRSDCVGEKNGYSQQVPEWVNTKSFVTLINKIDLVESREDRDILTNVLSKFCIILSVKTLEGFDSFLLKVKDLCAKLCDTGSTENPTLTTARHRTHISACLDDLKLILLPEEWTDPNSVPKEFDLTDDCLDSIHKIGWKEKNIGPEEKIQGNLLQYEGTIVEAAHHLHRATTSLGHVTGHITSEEVLNEIFSAFCIGK